MLINMPDVLYLMYMITAEPCATRCSGRFSLTVRQKTITPPEYKLELLVITSNKIR